MKSTPVVQKKRDYDPVTSIRLPKKLGKAIDEWCKANGVRGRSKAILHFVELGLTVPAKPSKDEPPGGALIPLARRGPATR